METVVITGANRGIGLGLVRRYVRHGSRIFACCRAPDQAEELADLAQRENITLVPLDVTDAAQVDAFVTGLGTQPIDILINNAGVMGGTRQSLSDMDYDAWREAFEINTIAPFRLTTALGQHLASAPRPRVVTVSSQMGALSRRSTGSHAYRSSKAAVNKVMQVLAVELENDGIIVCPIHPGWVRTDMGGSHAEISVEESAEGIFNLISDFTIEQSGRFWTWNGEEHAW